MGAMSKTTVRYSRRYGRSSSLFEEHAASSGSQWEAISSIAERMGCKSETLRRWVR